MSAFVITALATPALFRHSDAIYARLRPLLGRVGIRSRGGRAEAKTASGHRGWSCSAFIGSRRRCPRTWSVCTPTSWPTLIIDTNTAIHDEIRRRGARVVYGEIVKGEVLRHAGVDAAEVVVSTLPDEMLKGASNEQLVRTVRAVAPGAVIIAGSTQMSQIAALRAAGADVVFRAAAEVAHGILPAIGAALNATLPSFLQALEHPKDSRCGLTCEGIEPVAQRRMMGSTKGGSRCMTAGVFSDSWPGRPAPLRCRRGRRAPHRR